VPLRDGDDAITVNWLMIEISNAAGEVTYRNSFIADLPTGRGKQHLSAVLATLNLLAFAFHTVIELTHDLWHQAINTAGARRRFFEHLRSITVFLVFPSWQDLLTTLAFAHPLSQSP
jgi:hypothetical protein